MTFFLLFVQVEPQIAPIRVQGFDQFDLPGPVPFLDALLADDRVLDFVVMLDIDEANSRVLRGKLAAGVFAVLGDALGDRGGYAGV
ncbi:hypothetical protein [Sphingomonas sp. M1-B02]|uniref:hypothetical protein n=1 Tax=Sphingomonas sp. M1-B02 TaxID=3114300 RepID=UPI003FA7D1E8